MCPALRVMTGDALSCVVICRPVLFVAFDASSRGAGVVLAGMATFAVNLRVYTSERVRGMQRVRAGKSQRRRFG